MNSLEEISQRRSSLIKFLKSYNFIDIKSWDYVRNEETDKIDEIGFVFHETTGQHNICFFIPLGWTDFIWKGKPIRMDNRRHGKKSLLFLLYLGFFERILIYKNLNRAVNELIMQRKLKESRKFFNE
jgi:hypothetical protein